MLVDQETVRQEIIVNIETLVEALLDDDTTPVLWLKN
jgi:hypothetical protein